ncbi:MAG TPA: aminotransferase class I/II-fold pyridoxal phosphate-dependent enzyme [Candidatus Limnocylindrales bacterium]|nr:aminotransferase class I/II-fold pyridoxal phosphate-dependent enzyme [Candidatus Limnocylindrales bacterium]
MSSERTASGFGTRAIRAATRQPKVEQEPDAVPIYQSVTFSATDSADLGEILGDRRPGYAYARLDNPTTDAMARAVAELEGAPAGYAFASGMAAIHGALLALLGEGDHIVATRAVYGSTYVLFERRLRRLGIDVSWVDATDHRAVADAITGRTRLLYLETISNPTIVVSDLPALADLGHRHGLLVAVDNTFASPYLCRPMEHGADLVIESATKWLGGHSDVLAGVVCGSTELIERVRLFQIDTGASAAPMSAFLVLRGIETLHVRMDRHVRSARVLAEALEADPTVERVFYPGLPSHPQHRVAERLLDGPGGMLAFELPSREAAAAFVDGLSIPPRTASLGSVRTICVHPPSSTHRQMSDEELAAAGIPVGLVRVSVGLEDEVDLVADFKSGLAAARRAGSGAATVATPA